MVFAKTEWLLFDQSDVVAKIKSSTREGAELWARRHEERTGNKLRLVRRDWSYADTEHEVRPSELGSLA